jgi:1-acyl-sn-glycerol-3-phosphate acyltransferase
MLPFLRGTAWIALRTGAPIVPCGLKGTGRVAPPGTKKPRFGKRVEVNFGQAIQVEREDDHRARREKAEAITSELLAAIASLAS